jgi:TldD protein
MRINENEINQILDQTKKLGADWSDLFIEETLRNKIELSDNQIKNVSAQNLNGAGLRVVVQNQEFYGYTNDISYAGLNKVYQEISQLVQGLTGNPNLDQSSSQHLVQHPIEKLPSQASWKQKIDLLKKSNQIARNISEKITQVTVGYLDESQNILVANSNGLMKKDHRVRGRFTVGVVASDANNKQMGYESPGALRGFEFFESLDLERLASSPANQALKMLDADYAPQGRMPVIIDNGFGGVIFHEACGHSLEASAIAKKASVFTDKLGEVIASNCVSAVDDGTLKSEWGSTHIDDEGIPTQRNLLIENGILKSYLVDRLNGDRLGLKSTGSSRRESYRFAPTSRMNNTYILPGSDKLAEMISSMEYGLYAKKMGGGSVNPTTGEFNFAVNEGYLIENGKITKPVKGAVLIGRGDEVLKKIDKVGDELKLAQGVCGASSGWVPVNVGQPAIRVQDLLVGGQ